MCREHSPFDLLRGLWHKKLSKTFPNIQLALFSYIRTRYSTLLKTTLIIFILKLYNVFSLLILCSKIFPGHFRYVIYVQHVKAHKVLQQEDITSYLGSRAESHGTLTKLSASDDCHIPPDPNYILWNARSYQSVAWTTSRLWTTSQKALKANFALLSLITVSHRPQQKLSNLQI